MHAAVPADLEAVVKLLDLAFAPSRFESRLIRALATNARTTYQWLIESDCDLLAHICYSRAYAKGGQLGSTWLL